MFTLLLERQHDLIPRVSSAAANQRGAWGGIGGGSSTWSGALTNQAHAAESINITISKNQSWRAAAVKLDAAAQTHSHMSAAFFDKLHAK